MQALAGQCYVKWYEYAEESSRSNPGRTEGSSARPSRAVFSCVVLGPHLMVAWMLRF